MLRIKQFLTTEIWRIRKKNLPRSKSFFLTHLRIILLSLRGFAEDKCQLRASALTFFSLLSIVPIFAMAFGIAKGFGLEKKLEELVTTNVQGQEEVLGRIIEFARKLLENTSGGIVAGIGIGVLFWSVIKVLGHIESAFNDIWGIKTSRSLIRKFSDYLSIMLICPILLIVSSSATVFVQSQVALIVDKLAFLGPVASVILFTIKFLPYCVLWIVFSFIYIVLPNTNVKISSGIFAGVVGGTIYQLLQWAYIIFQMSASKYGAIYGSFAALPLFLLWLQMSWVVVLLGAEFSFAHQNVDTYELEPDCLDVSPSFKRLISLRIVHMLIKRFTQAEMPLSAAAISHSLEIPPRLVNDVLFDLVKAGLVIEVKSENDKVHAYQPAQETERFTIGFVLEALDKSGTETLPLEDDAVVKKIRNCLSVWHDTLRTLPENVLLKNI
jgi:membrane protein